MATKFILVLLSKNILKIRYSKSCILYHITYTTIESLHHQPLRFILTFKSNRCMISFGRKHSKYDMNIYLHASFLGIAFKYFIDDKDYTAQSVCKNNWIFVCLYKSQPSICFELLYNFLLMCNAFVFCLKEQDIMIMSNEIAAIHCNRFYPFSGKCFFNIKPLLIK